MSDTTRWFDKQQNKYRMGLDLGYKCKYCDNESHRDVVQAWKLFNPFLHKKENKRVRKEHARMVRHQNKISLKTGRYPEAKIHPTNTREYS